MPKGLIFVVLQTTLEIESMIFFLKDFEIGEVWRIVLPLSTHGLALILMFFGFIDVWDRKKPQDRAWMAMGLCMTMPLPMLGYLGFVVLYATNALGIRPQGDLLYEFRKYVDPDKGLVGERRVTKKEIDLYVRGQVDVAPLKSILSSHDLASKRGVVLTLAERPSPESVELLKRCLADDSREIRYYASTSLSDMEKEFNDEIYRLVRKTEQQPTDVEKLFELAIVVLRYIETGLLEDEMIQHFIKIGLDAMDKAKIVAPGDYRIYLLIGLLNKMGKRLDLAEEYLLMYLNSIENDPSFIKSRWPSLRLRGQSKIEEVFVALSEAAYLNNNIDRAREVIRKAQEYFPESQQIKDLGRIIGLPKREAV